jgi:hypothetical protein
MMKPDREIFILRRNQTALRRRPICCLVNEIKGPPTKAALESKFAFFFSADSLAAISGQVVVLS